MTFCGRRDRRVTAFVLPRHRRRVRPPTRSMSPGQAELSEGDRRVPPGRVTCSSWPAAPVAGPSTYCGSASIGHRRRRGARDVGPLPDTAWGTDDRGSSSMRGRPVRHGGRTRRFDAVLFGFWISHVPEERFAESFWQLVADGAPARVVSPSSSTTITVPDDRVGRGGRSLADRGAANARRCRRFVSSRSRIVPEALQAAHRRPRVDRASERGRRVLLGRRDLALTAVTQLAERSTAMSAAIAALFATSATFEATLARIGQFGDRREHERRAIGTR